MKDLNNTTLQLGDVVYIYIYCVYKHYGIVVREAGFDGNATVRTVLCTENKPINQSISEFSNGKHIHVTSYKSDVPRWVAVQNALDVTNFKYNVLKNNCEHFYRRVHELADISPQVLATTAALCIGTVLFFKKPILRA